MYVSGQGSTKWTLEIQIYPLLQDVFLSDISDFLNGWNFTGDLVSSPFKVRYNIAFDIRWKLVCPELQFQRLIQTNFITSERR